MIALMFVVLPGTGLFADNGQNWRWVRRWLLGRMRKRFERNETEIHRLEAQLHTMWDEWLELDGDDEGKDRMTNHLYEWYKEAGLPMSDEFRDLFAAELGLESAKRTGKALEDAVYEDEEARLRRLADKAVGVSNGPGVSYDGSRLLYDGDDGRLASLVDRINKISDGMDDAEPGSGVTQSLDLVWRSSRDSVSHWSPYASCPCCVGRARAMARWPVCSVSLL